MRRARLAQSWGCDGHPHRRGVYGAVTPVTHTDCVSSEEGQARLPKAAYEPGPGDGRCLEARAFSLPHSPGPLPSPVPSTEPGSQALGHLWEACSQLGSFPPGSTPSSSSVSRPTSPSGSRPASSPATSSSPKMPPTSVTSGSSCPTTGGNLGPSLQLQGWKQVPRGPSVSAPLLPEPPLSGGT